MPLTGVVHPGSADPSADAEFMSTAVLSLPVEHRAAIDIYVATVYGYV